MSVTNVGSSHRQRRLRPRRRRRLLEQLAGWTVPSPPEIRRLHDGPHGLHGRQRPDRLVTCYSVSLAHRTTVRWAETAQDITPTVKKPSAGAHLMLVKLPQTRRRRKSSSATERDCRSSSTPSAAGDSRFVLGDGRRADTPRRIRPWTRPRLSPGSFDLTRPDPTPISIPRPVPSQQLVSGSGLLDGGGTPTSDGNLRRERIRSSTGDLPLRR